MSQFLTVVFKVDTEESKKKAQAACLSRFCTAWSTEDEMLRMELIEQALDHNDIEQARVYLREPQVDKYLHKVRLTS